MQCQSIMQEGLECLGGLKCESLLHPYSDEDVPQWKGNAKKLQLLSVAQGSSHPYIYVKYQRLSEN